MNDYFESIKILQDAAIPVTQTAYGFSLCHSTLNDSDRNFAECGVEHDSSISMSVRDGSSQAWWFFRIDFREMAYFILSAYKNAGNQATREDLLHEMKELDKKYNNVELEKHISEYIRKIESRHPR